MSGRVLFQRIPTGEFVPLDHAASNWAGRTTVRGLAVSSLLAKACEDVLLERSLDGHQPGRWTVDLSRPTLMEPCRVRAQIVRVGRRLILVDVELLQRDDQVTARARAVFLRKGDAGEGTVWEHTMDLPLPPESLVPTTREPRLYWSSERGWTADAAPHQNAHRKQVWIFPYRLLNDGTATPFQLAAGAADVASVVTQWGDRGLRHINVDLSLHLVRLPMRLEDGVGLAALHRASTGATSVGTAVMRDRSGTIGSVTVTALANESYIVDPRHRD